MKRPLLNQEERFLATTDTTVGAGMRLGLAAKHLERDIGKMQFYKKLVDFIDWLEGKLV